MVNWLRCLSVSTRIMALVFLMLSLTLAMMGFLLFELDQIGKRSLLQQNKVAEQNSWIERQAKLIATQSDTQGLQKKAQNIQKLYAEMLFWYFDGSITQYYESLNKAELSADQLEKGLTTLATDPIAEQRIAPMLELLTQYRVIMEGAIGYYQQGRNNMAAAEISDAHLIVQNMNDQLLVLTELFQQRLTSANREVENALSQTLVASQLVKQSSEQSSERIVEVSKLTMGLLLVSIPLSASIAFMIVFSITRPLKQLRQQLLAIDHNSDLTQPLTLEGEDEIREMSEATQSLLEKLRGTLTDVGVMATQLKSTADNGYQASAVTHQQSTEQQQQSEGIASAAAQLGASAEDISRSTQQGLVFVENVQAAATRGQSDVQATAQSIQRLAYQFEQVESTVRRLASKSDSIGKVLDVIRDIADQTNLLALNAAIEAARAGEQGRGFAVVADEVRTLAQRTGQSTDEIRQMVEALQKQSRIAINSLDTNRHQVDSGVALSQQAEFSLNKIQQEMKALIDMNQSIAVVTREQQQAVLSVDESVQMVRELACDVETHAADSKVVTQELHAMAELLQGKLLAFRH